MKEQEFNFWVPLEDEDGYLEKAAKTEKGDDKRYENMYLAGMASDNVKDSEGEVLEPAGYDLSRFLKSGFINFEHKSKNDPKYLIGEPVAAEVKGDEFHVKGKLYKESEIARNLWDTVIMMKASGATRKLGWSIEGRATERSIVDPKRITKALITGIALTFNPVNTNSFAEICKGEQKQDHIDYEYDESLIQKSETAKYIYTFESDGKQFGITKSFEVEEIDKCMDVESTRALIPESLDKKVRVLEPTIKKAIQVGLIPLKYIDRIEKGGKRAVIGEIREWSGVKYRKSATGWDPVKMGSVAPIEKPEAKKEVVTSTGKKSALDNPDVLARDSDTGLISEINFEGTKFKVEDQIKNDYTGYTGEIVAFSLHFNNELSNTILVHNLEKDIYTYWDLSKISKLANKPKITPVSGNKEFTREEKEALQETISKLDYQTREWDIQYNAHDVVTKQNGEKINTIEVYVQGKRGYISDAVKKAASAIGVIPSLHGYKIDTEKVWSSYSRDFVPLSQLMKDEKDLGDGEWRDYQEREFGGGVQFKVTKS